MKQWWQQQVVRIDALSLRERAFLFLSVIVVCMALADVLWLSPAQVAHQQATQRFAAQGTELSRLRDELKSTAQPVDASKAVRDDIAAANARLEAVNQEIKAVAPLADGGPGLEQVLVQFLRRQEGLTLLSTGTLKQDAAIPVAPATVAAPTGLSRRGMELRVAGPYPELVRYVKTLEIALPALRWGALQLKSEKQPPELTLQVYVVGVQP